MDAWDYIIFIGLWDYRCSALILHVSSIYRDDIDY